MKALFINPGGLGDQILLLPTLRLFKDKYPNCEVDLITEPRSSVIGELTNLYRKIKTFDFKEKYPDFIKLRELIRRHRYKYLFSSGASYKANFVASLADAEVKIGFYKGFFSRFLLTHPVKLNTKQYTSNIFSSLLFPIMPELRNLISNKELIPEIKLNQDAIVWAKETLKPRIKERYYAKKIFIHPGVSKLSIQKNILKSWSPSKWALLIEKLLEKNDNTVVLLGGKDDLEIVAEIHKKLTFFTRPSNFIDFSSLELSLQNLGALISASDLFVCTDSAPMHLGVALCKRLVAFFGPTNPLKLLPKDSRFVAVHVDNLKCRPCLFDTRKESCSTPVCLDVSVDMMLNAINEQLQVTEVS